jgi:uncharacterized delta-60 repeat protein
VVANPTAGDEVLQQVAVVPSGGSFSIYVGGNAPASGGTTPVAFAAIKLTPAGQPDSTFGSGGFAVRRVGVNPSTITSAMAVLPSGEVVLAGMVQPQAGANGAGALVAFTPAGQPDPGFGTGGVAYPSVPGTVRNVIYGLAVQGNSLLVAGSTFYVQGQLPTGVLYRYTAAGTPDPTFAVGGVFLGPVGTATTGSLFGDVAVAADGTVALSGRTFAKDASGATTYGLLLGRVSADGQPDPAFGPAPDGTGLTVVTGPLVVDPTVSRLTLDAAGDFLFGSVSAADAANPLGRGTVVRYTGH